MIFTTNLFSIFICLSTKSIFIMWFFMELNMVTFVVILNLNFCKFQSVASMKYFCIQSMLSLLILIFLILKEMNFNTMFYTMAILLLMKLGAAPFHGWFVAVVLKINWFCLFWASTAQKMIPLMLLMVMKKFIMLNLLLLATVMTVLSAVKQLNLKKLLAYSSIFSVNWLISTMLLTGLFWMKFLLIYSALKLVIIYINYSAPLTLNKFSLSLSPPMLAMALITSLFAIGGLPPLPMFFIKLALLTKLVPVHSLLATLLIFSSVILMYMYISMALKFIHSTTQSHYLQPFQGSNYLKMAPLLAVLGVNWVLLLVLQKPKNFDFLLFN